MFSQFPWVKERGLSGDEVYLEAVSSWSLIQREIVEKLSVEKIKVEDPFVDWESSLQKVQTWVLNARE